MFKTRFISGAVLTLLTIGILYLGGYVTGVAVMLLSLGGVFELMRVYKQEKSALAVLAYLMTIAYYCFLFFDLQKYLLPLVIGYILLVLFVYVVTYPRYTDKNAMSAILAFFYVSLFLSFLYQVRELKYGGALVVMVYICSWINDTFAYCVGVKFGKHKMSPKLSPKKSVEGLFGGILGSALVGGLYGIFFEAKIYDLANAPLIFAAAGAIGAGFAVVGDLTASAIKRNNDIKDYGKLIPGHGGILDRFDSIIFTAPIVYYCFKIMIGNLGGAM